MPFPAILSAIGGALTASPAITGGLISAGASLIGGNQNRMATKEANEANRPANQVAEWEAAGINPIFGLSSGAYVPHQAATIGDAFATAGAQFARGLNMDHSQKLAETELAMENTRLKAYLDDLSIRRERTALQREQLPLPGGAERTVPTETSRNVVDATTGIEMGPTPPHLDTPDRVVRLTDPYVVDTDGNQIPNMMTPVVTQSGDVIHIGDHMQGVENSEWLPLPEMAIGDPAQIAKLAALGGAAYAGYRVLGAGIDAGQRRLSRTPEAPEARAVREREERIRRIDPANQGRTGRGGGGQPGQTWVPSRFRVLRNHVFPTIF